MITSEQLRRDHAIRALLGWPEAADAAAAPAVARTRRPRRPLWLLVLVAWLAAAAACDERAPGVVLWHAYNGAERDALETTAARWNTDHPDRPLELVAVPFGAFGDKLTSAIPNGNGPDLFIYPEDRIGDWADAGVIEPIEFWLDDARADRFSRESLEAMAYRGSLWGLPLNLKSLVLFYRTDLVAAAPRTTDELLALAPGLRARDAHALAYTNPDLYGHAPWLFGFGGHILDDAGALAIATPQATAALAFVRDLVTRGVAPAQTDGPSVATLFNEGRAATAVSGPWFVAGIARGVPWQVAPLPVISATGQPARPFRGAEGVRMSARARDKEAAFAVMDALTSDAAAIERAKIARVVVPNAGAYDDPDVAGDPILAAYRAQLVHTVQLPQDPAMRMVWTPYKTALGEVLAGRSSPAETLRGVAREVQGYLDGRRR